MKELFVRTVLLIIFIVIAFFFMTSVYGCATTNAGDPLGILDMLDEELDDGTYKQTPSHPGWNSLGTSGNHWAYLIEDKEIVLSALASCDYQYVKYNSIEMWRGTYYGHKTDFMMGQTLTESDLPNLYGCVEWVRHQMMGDHYI